MHPFRKNLNRLCSARCLRLYLASLVCALFMGMPLGLQAIPTEGLTAYWTFDNDLDNSALASGNVSPAAPSNLDLSAVGDASFDPNGLFGQAAHFDGEGDYLEIKKDAPSDDKEVVEDEPVTETSISVWFKADRAPSGSERFFIFETSPNYTLSLGLREATDPNYTRVQVFTESLGGANANIAASVLDIDIADQWVHVAVTLSVVENELTVVVNGGVSSGGTSASVPINSAVLAPFDDFHIGTYRDGDARFFPGLIDEFAIWNRILTPEELFPISSRSYVNALNGNGDGSSWANAYPTLQDALANAVSGQEIWVAEGTYYPDKGNHQVNDDRSSTFALISGVKIYGGFKKSGNPTFAERNPALYETILSGDIDQNDSSGGDNSGNAYHVLSANLT